MDTKWKKLKIVLKFACFFLGVTLLICNLIPAFRMWKNGNAMLGKEGADYQEQAEFRSIISGRLETLLAAATGGKGWQFYGAAGDVIYQGNGNSCGEYSSTVLWEEEQEAIAARNFEILQEEPWRWDGDAWNDEGVREKTIKEYMADMAQNKNLRYAVIYQKKLLYTNVEAYEDRIGENWSGENFYESLDPQEYNFTLWFNQAGDGKVQITKDGQMEEIYGDGVYTASSRWFVPGYSNFNVDASTKEAVVFLAAAKEPKLYISGDYSQYGTNQYGGQLYYLKEHLSTCKAEFQSHCILAAAGALFAFLFWRGKGRADQAIARFLGKLWLELKVALAILVPVIFFLAGSRQELTDMAYGLAEGGFEGYFWDTAYYFGDAAGNGIFLGACFWILYLAVLDLRANRGRQKKPLIDGMRAKDLSYPVQKRMVRRGRLILISALGELVSAGLLLGIVFWLGNVFSVEDYIGNIWNLAIIAAFILGVFIVCWGLAGIAYLRKNRRLAEDVGALSDQIAAVQRGNLTKPLAFPKDSDLAQAAESLNEIQRGLEEALREQMHSERMKVELVTNVSHDIKTPLTSIISYVDLLKQEEELPVHVQEFVQILWEKSQRLKTIVQDVFDVSKAVAGQLPVNLEELDLGRLLRQVLADMDSPIAASGLQLRISVSEDPLYIRADGQRLYRVFQNLLQNALKYSLAGSRIYLTMAKEGTCAVVYLKNTSGMELDAGIDFAERFVRGDASRTDGGSGLGLSIAKSFTEACGGSFRVEIDADLFTVTVAFPTAG